jgi:hypothetical protein
VVHTRVRQCRLQQPERQAAADVGQHGRRASLLPDRPGRGLWAHKPASASIEASQSRRLTFLRGGAMQEWRAARRRATLAAENADVDTMQQLPSYQTQLAPLSDAPDLRVRMVCVRVGRHVNDAAAAGQPRRGGWGVRSEVTGGRHGGSPSAAGTPSLS